MDSSSRAMPSKGALGHAPEEMDGAHTYGETVNGKGTDGSWRAGSVIVTIGKDVNAVAASVMTMHEEPRQIMHHRQPGTSLEVSIVARAQEEVARRRRDPVGRRNTALLRMATWFAAHWLALFNTLNALMLIGVLLAPWFRSAGYNTAANALYAFYHLQCPQRPEHSFFLFEYKLGLEHREIALYGGWLIAGLVFAMARTRVRPLPFLIFLLASIPMVLDIGSQMVGLRESTWAWRVSTGLIFALASGWWIFPRFEEGARLAMDRSHKFRLPRMESHPG